jgi:hypothetical protein
LAGRPGKSDPAAVTVRSISSRPAQPLPNGLDTVTSAVVLWSRVRPAEVVICTRTVAFPADSATAPTRSSGFAWLIGMAVTQWDATQTVALRPAGVRVGPTHAVASTWTMGFR